MDAHKKAKAKTDLLEEMDEFLSGGENAFKSFVTFYNIAPQGKKEYGRIKITPIEDKFPWIKNLSPSRSRYSNHYCHGRRPYAHPEQVRSAQASSAVAAVISAEFISFILQA